MADPVPVTIVGSKKQSSSGEASFTLVSDFNGYRNKEDITNLPAGILVKGSQNVLTSTGGDKVTLRKGYTLDGQANTTIAPILSSYDWITHNSFERNLRVGNGKIQVRYVAAAGDKYLTNTFTDGQVYWIDLLTTTSNNVNFADWWDPTALRSTLLMVNHTTDVLSWTGGMTTVKAVTASTIEKNGTTTWVEEGFNNDTLATVGDSTTQFDITNPTGTTFRYTWDTTGTTPAISSATFPVGSYVLIGAQNFNAANNGLFVVTGVGTNYFEVTNASGVAENNKTIGTGYIYKQFRKLLLNGTTVFGYTGGEGTTTLTGVTPSAAGITVNSVIMQQVVVTNNTAITSMPAAFVNDLISIRKNQVYYGSLVNRQVYISTQADWKSVAYTSPVRVIGEGAVLTLDSTPVAFMPQEDAMYISAGKNWIYQTKFTLSSDNSKEILTVEPIKFSELQAAQSQGLVGKMKNDILFVTNEPSLDSLGRVSGIFGSPQTTDISDSIMLDFDNYDFTDGHVFYYRNFIYIAIPQHNTVRIFNVVKGWWETPQILPISRFAVIDGELYGHSYQTPETFKLFEGTSDNGNPIDARMIMSYQNYGTRSACKSFDEAYYEGYIRGNTKLTFGIKYEIDGCAQTQSYIIDGSDTQVVCVSSTNASLGKTEFGKNPFGTSTQAPSIMPKMRGIKTFGRKDFYEVQFSFSSYGIDYAWEILAFGALVSRSPYNNAKIKQ
jgi:hypothetical protein